MIGEQPTPGRKPATRKPARAAAPIPGARWQGVDQASRAMADILAGLFVWGGVGWLADRWLGFDPWLMSAGIVVGFGGGLYMVWLRTKPDASDRAAGTHVQTGHERPGV